MKKPKCETCEYKGYSIEFCRYHSISGGGCETPGPAAVQHPVKRIGKAVAVGAGAGLAATFAGIALGPFVGLKAIVSHAIATKITVGGGVAGAGINAALNIKGDASKGRPGRKRPLLVPHYVKG